MNNNDLIRFCAKTPHLAAGLVLVIAKTGNAEAQAHLAQLLLDGQGIKRDPVLALTWFKLAAKADHSQAINMVGRCFENGWGCSVDFVQAAYYYQLATDKSLDWGMYNLANLLIKGKGVEKNFKKAFELYQQAALAGHAKSMNLVGRFYEEGWFVESDIETAIHWYQRSAAAGDFRGQCSYALVLAAKGYEDEAVVWLRYSMRTATHGFMQKMAQALWQSEHEPFKQIAKEMFERCNAQGNEQDQQAHEVILATEKQRELTTKDNHAYSHT